MSLNKSDEYAKVKAERDALYTTLRQVKACFDSRKESSTCIEDHHPSCSEYITSALEEINNGKP